MLKPIAVWNPEKEIWEKENPSSSKQWVLFSATFPTSGMMRGGKLFPLPQSVPPTAETESSSTPIPEECFHTPEPLLTHRTKDRIPGASLPDWATRSSGELKVKLLPTPRATRGGSATETLNLLQPIPEQTEKLPMLPAHEGRVDDRPDFSTTKARRAAPAAEEALTLFPTPGASDGNGGKSPKDLSATIRASGAKRQVCLPEAVKLLPTPSAADGVGGRYNSQGHQSTHHFPVEEQPQAIPVLWGKYEPAVRRWEKLTRSAPIPTEPNKNGNPRLAAPFSEWMMGWPEGWVTDPEIGLPRTAQLKIIGNGVCPQQAYSAITELLSIHASEERMIQ